MKHRTTILLCLASLGLATQAARAQIFVNCFSDPDALQDAIDAGFDSIQFEGTCSAVEISGVVRLEIYGSGPINSVVNDRVLISGSQEILLDGFSVQIATEPPAFISVLRGSFVTLRNMSIQGGSLAVTDNSGVRVRDSTISAAEFDQAVQILRNSTATFSGNNAISSPNIESAVIIGNSANLLFTGSGNEIRAQNALQVNIGSTAEIRNGDIFGDIALGLHSLALFGARPGIPGGGFVSIDGNIRISQDSGIVFSAEVEPVSFSGLAVCDDAESSAAGLPQNQIKCSRF